MVVWLRGILSMAVDSGLGRLRKILSAKRNRSRKVRGPAAPLTSEEVAENLLRYPYGF
jgi:hypothetical protein